MVITNRRRIKGFFTTYLVLPYNIVLQWYEDQIKSRLLVCYIYIRERGITRLKEKSIKERNKQSLSE